MLCRFSFVRWCSRGAVQCAGARFSVYFGCTEDTTALFVAFHAVDWWVAAVLASSAEFVVILRLLQRVMLLCRMTVCIRTFVQFCPLFMRIAVRCSV